jgi:hypothetical protein
MTSPFDERAALDELERFRQEIERERARRKAVSDQFESFVQSFKKPAPPSPVPAEAGPVVASKAAPPPAPVHRPPERPRIELPRETPAVTTGTVEREVVIAPRLEASPAPRRRSSLAVGLVALLLVAAAIAWLLWRPAAPPATSTQSTPATEPGPVPGTPPSGVPGEPATTTTAGSEPAAPAAAPTGTELTTIRTVWVRVIVDGERVLERELPADSRIPLTPTKTIVIRTGDAGAVRLTVAGQDQGFLGREGQVVTRTFTVPGS